MLETRMAPRPETVRQVPSPLSRRKTGHMEPNLGPTDSPNSEGVKYQLPYSKIPGFIWLAQNEPAGLGLSFLHVPRWAFRAPFLEPLPFLGAVGSIFRR